MLMRMGERRPRSDRAYDRKRIAVLRALNRYIDVETSKLFGVSHNAIRRRQRCGVLADTRKFAAAADRGRSTTAGHVAAFRSGVTLP